ncbi:aminopeptidase P family protein [uncultured Sutterella sp.]|uniref:aminopeptidase P family protein n=1 Tax=uncultured Sutterella sp. TaxID=286133 RepID=UPI0025DD39CF|nr:aminopeptidase P family protein [uncultured Sutterella sp.]
MLKQLEALERLARCRRETAALGLAGLIVPTADPHLSEYVPDAWKLREALSGFTGSAGTLLVTADAAALVADSRYWEQATRQLPKEIELVKLTAGLQQTIVDWFAARLSSGVVGADPELISAAAAEDSAVRFAVRGLDFREEAPDVARLWPDRPAPSLSRVREMKRPCRCRGEKLAAVRAALEKAGAGAVILNALDDVAWTTNLRGADVPCNPVFTATLLVGLKKAALFVDAARLEPGVEAALLTDGVRTAPPEALPEAVYDAARSGAVLYDPEHTNAAIARLVPAEHTVTGPSPVLMLKCVKTSAEIAAIDEAMLEDAVALAEFYAELDERLAAGVPTTEGDAAAMLHAWRAKGRDFFDESFPTISAFGPNGALPHYAVPADGGARLEGDGLLLIDSGGQYECGTTDITRMTPVGEPTEEMKADVGLVTRAMLRLLRLRFPRGATGAGIDLAARIDLWEKGLDFGHGTGHGVGYVLNVHEGPVTISPRAKPVPLAPGNVLSDEPGLYRTGRWGVRVENLMVCEEDVKTEFGEFLRFRALTMMPIDTRALPAPFGPLADELNRFNAERVEKLAPLVSARCRAWFERAVRPVSES